MNMDKRRAVEKALPKNFRIKWIPADLEGPAEMIWRICPPDHYLIQKATKRGFLGFFRGWQTIGELDAEDDVLFLSEDYYKELAYYFRQILNKNGIHVTVGRGVAGSTIRYLARLGREPSQLARFRHVRETLDNIPRGGEKSD